MWKWCDKSELLSRCFFKTVTQFVISDQSVTSNRSLRDFSWESVFAARTCDCSSTLTCTGFVAALCACKCARSPKRVRVLGDRTREASSGSTLLLLLCSSVCVTMLNIHVSFTGSILVITSHFFFLLQTLQKEIQVVY